MKGRQILVVDDEPKMRRVLEIMLQKMGHRVLAAGNGVEALALFQANSVDLVITDLRMPEMDGIELLAALRAQASDVPVMVITAHGTIETAVAAMKHGACDYILRPFDIDVVELAVERVLNGAAVAQQNAFLRQEIERGWDAFVGTSEPMRAVYELIQRVGPSKASVLITGETGTGKELAARALHHASPRRDKLFVPINCAAIPADILESELFGYEKGAFTGAVKERVGKFELADGGTIFLDELTEMPLPLQAAAARAAGKHHRAPRRQPHHRTRLARHRRHQPRSAGKRAGRQAARRPLLPGQRVLDRTAAPARADRRHRRPGRALHRQARPFDGSDPPRPAGARAPARL